MTGLFGRAPKDPQKKKNVEKIKRVRRLVREQKYDEALKTGLEYLQKVPHNHDVLFIVGGIYYMKRQYRSALRHLDHAAEIGTYDVDVLLLKANAHMVLGDKKLAKECCDKILEVDEKNEGVREILGKLDL